MSLNLYLVLHPPIQGLDANVADRIVLAKFGKDLDNLAVSLKVSPLSAFYSYDLETLAEFADDDTVEEMQRKGNLPIWFEASMGLISIRALRDRLRAGTDAFPFDKEQAAHELDDVERILVMAERQGSKFRLYSAF